MVLRGSYTVRNWRPRESGLAVGLLMRRDYRSAARVSGIAAVLGWLVHLQWLWRG